MYSALTRDEFVDWLGGLSSPKPEILQLGRKLEVAKGKILLVWPDPNTNSQKPSIIAIAEEEIRDFFAFVSTYVATFKPFSAFFNVVALEDLDLVLGETLDSASQNSKFPGLIGVALAEAYAQSRSKTQSLNDLTVQGVRATLSATLLSAVFQGFRSEGLEKIALRWVDARGLTSDGSLTIGFSDTLEVWKLIGSALDEGPRSKSKHSKNLIEEALRTGFKIGSNFDDWFLPFVASAMGTDKHVRMLKGAREERIRSIPLILEGIFNLKVEPEVREFLAGGLLSMVGNGSLAHLQLTDRLVGELPGAVLWFGALSALQSQSDCLTASDCLGRRVVRDLMVKHDRFGSPNFDVSLDELKVLGDRAVSGVGMRSMHSNLIEIGLLGSVHAPFRRPSPRQDEERLNTEKVLAERLEELRFLLDRASRVAADLHRPRQRELFEKEQSERFRRK